MSKKEIIRELRIKNNGLSLDHREMLIANGLLDTKNKELHKKNELLCKDNQALSEDNTKLRKVLERMSREEVANKSSEKTLVEIINIHCENNQNYFNSIMCLLSQRDKMQQQLNEKDYIICQLESALEAANVI